MHRGYTKRWRKRWDKGYHKDTLLWMMMDYFIDHANWKENKMPFVWKGKLVEMVTIKRGECFFTYKGLADFFNHSKNRVSRRMVRERVKILADIEFLEHKSGHQYQIISVLNYDKYNPLDNNECHQSEHKPDTNQPPISHQSATPNKDNKFNKDKNLIKDIIEYLNKKTGKSFKTNSKETVKLIRARLNAGFSKDDFYIVIDNKVTKWLTDPKMSEYLRPQTLFGTKFESYLQDTPKSYIKKDPEPTTFAQKKQQESDMMSKWALEQRRQRENETPDNGTIKLISTKSQ